MIIDSKIEDLVSALEQDGADLSEARFGETLSELVRSLAANCASPEARKRYSGDPQGEPHSGDFPMRGDGFAESLDPVADEESFYDCFRRFGIVVGKSVAPESLCKSTISRAHDIASQLSGGACDLSRPDTYEHIPLDEKGVPLLSRGFFEVYHDRALAEIRQAVRVYIHHVVVWGRSDLWTSFDRLGIKLPEHEESAALPLHVDQNPLQQPGFETIQGVLALADCPAERGTFVGVPGSRAHFPRYTKLAARGEYVELDMDDPLAAELAPHAKPIPIRAGDLVTWDSRTTHANTANMSDQTRYVAYLAAGPVPARSDEALAHRMEAFRTGLGTNVRGALMHASKKPRYTAPEEIASIREPERLTVLGELLYGQRPYKSL